MDRDGDDQEGLGNPRMGDMSASRDMDGMWVIMNGVAHMVVSGGGRYE